MKKYWGIITVLLAVGLAVFFYFRFYFVFGEGVKSGELNYVVYKGLVFKTYEGKLIQTGIRSKAAGSIQSYEFEFSVEDDAARRQDPRIALPGVFRCAALAGFHEIRR